jgi:hypothetical protein
MQSQDIPNIFCSKTFLPPTTTRHWKKSLDNIIHYDGCCPIYNELIKKEKEERIKIYLYEFKINKWVCPHTEKYYDDKFNKFNDNKEKFAPPPLIFKYAWPECCMHDYELTYSQINQGNPLIQFCIEDALNDPDVIKQYNDYVQLK